MKFADSIGLVYFGYVDQQSDEHRLVRGATVSTEHTDNNYCIGSFEGYDITLVERADTLHFPGKDSRKQSWLIMAFDLHRNVDLPHIFVGQTTTTDAFYTQLFTKYAYLRKMPDSSLGSEGQNFLQQFVVFTAPDQVLSAGRLLSPDLMNMVQSQFQGLSFELAEGVLYVYKEDAHVAQPLLEKMLKSGIWLARYFDENSAKV